MQPMKVGRRTLLFGAGDAASGLYVIASGVVKLALPTAGRSEKVIALLGPGDTFGLSALVLEKPHVVAAMTVRESELAYLPKQHLLAALRRERRLARGLLAELSRSLHDVLADVHMTATQSGIQRSASFLLQQVHPSIRRGVHVMQLPARKADIASKLALTPAHFSRLLRELASAGVITLKGSSVTVRDVRALRRYASGRG
jgi:CRP-like cAMP-binding protein